MVSTQEQFPQPGQQGIQADIILPNVFNESDLLMEVIVGYADNMGDNYHAGFHKKKNNQKSERSEATGDGPDKVVQTAELHEFADVLRENGVIVYEPTALPKEAGNYSQVYPRDIGFVLGETFVVSSMRRRSRMNEWRGIEHLIDRMPRNKVEWAPEGVFVEGGDIVVDKGHVFVGLSQRTNLEGYTYVANLAAERGFKPVPVPLKDLASKIDVLHLDCAFVPAGDSAALTFLGGFEYLPKEIRDNYNLITVRATEQKKLATNMFTISPTKIVTHDSAGRINDKLSKHGLEPIPIKFDEATKYGGNLRCCTLPLVRIGSAG